MKFNVETTTSYNSIHPAYQYTEQFNNNCDNYREGTKWFGIFLAFVSGTFFTISSSLVKAVRNVHPMVLLGIRSIVQIIIMSVIACANSKNLIGPQGQRLLITFQGFVGGLTLSLLYFSFRKLPIGDATTIIFSSPVIVIALSFLILREPCGFLRIIVICALFMGVVLVAKPPFIFQQHKNVTYDVVGYVYALLATLFTALNIVVMRKCMEIHYSIIVLSLSVWSLASAVVFYYVFPEEHHHDLIPKDWITWALIMTVAMTGLCGQVLVAKALQVEGAGKVSVTRSLDIILGYAIQIYFFKDVPTASSIAGAFLILVSIVCMGFEKEIYGVCDFIP